MHFAILRTLKFLLLFTFVKKLCVIKWQRYGLYLTQSAWMLKAIEFIAFTNSLGIDAFNKLYLIF